MFSLKSLYFYIISLMLCFYTISDAADNILVPSNEGKMYLKDANSLLFPGTITYTTDGSGHLHLINSNNPVDDDITVDGYGKAYLNGSDGKLYPIVISYTTDGNGNVIPIPSGGGGGGTPGGDNNTVQYNSSGSFAGSDSFLFDGSKLTLNGAFDAEPSGTQDFIVNENTSDGGVSGAFGVTHTGAVYLQNVLTDGLLSFSAAGFGNLEGDGLNIQSFGSDLNISSNSNLTITGSGEGQFLSFPTASSFNLSSAWGNIVSDSTGVTITATAGIVSLVDEDNSQIALDGSGNGSFYSPNSISLFTDSFTFSMDNTNGVFLSGLGTPGGVVVAAPTTGKLTLSNGFVGITRTIGTTAPLAGGGNLGSNLTLSMPASTNGQNGYLTSADHTTFSNKANTASPAFTGTPTAPTQAPLNNSTNLATTAYTDLAVLAQGGLSSVTTAGLTTTLTVTSSAVQVFTGTATQSVILPVVSTLALGDTFIIVNQSTGNVTTKSSGSNNLQIQQANTILTARCISISGTGTASWIWSYLPIANAIPITNITTLNAILGAGQMMTTNFQVQNIRNPSGTVIVNTPLDTINDLSGNLAFDVNARQFDDSTNELSFDFQNRIAYDSTQNLSLNYTARQLGDTAGNPVSSWGVGFFNVLGTSQAYHFQGMTSVPTIAAGAGAGTLPTVGITGNDVSSQITVTTGTLPTGGAVVATITFNKVFGTAPNPVFSAANSNASILNGATMVYCTATTTNYVITSGTAGLAAATTYIWNVHNL